jgi:hypothetical protein
MLKSILSTLVSVMKGKNVNRFPYVEIGVGAKEFSYPRSEPHGDALPRQISGGAFISAVDFACNSLTGWTIDYRLRAADKKGNGTGHLNDPL